jgi:hypothetical protein
MADGHSSSHKGLEATKWLTATVLLTKGLESMKWLTATVSSHKGLESMADDATVLLTETYEMAVPTPQFFSLKPTKWPYQRHSSSHTETYDPGRTIATVLLTKKD